MRRFRMRRRAIESSIILLATLGLALGLSLAQESKPAPAKARLVVTYYFLPG
jgi:hypothetical protein